MGNFHVSTLWFGVGKLWPGGQIWPGFTRLWSKERFLHFLRLV